MRTILVFALVSLFGSITFAGNERGNGTEDSRLDDNSAWFLGGRNTVKYCIESDSYFDGSVQDHTDLVERAIAQWVEYIGKKNVNEKRIDSMVGDASLSTTFLMVGDGKEGACDNLNADLTFYLNVENSKVEKELKSHYRPKGLAIREEYSVEKGWGRGYIWIIAPVKWQSMDEQVAFALLLHELGHVFGNGHIQGTIMRPDYIEYTTTIESNRIYQKNIDQEAQLAICEKCNFDLKLLVAEKNMKNTDLLLGRDPIGEVKIEVVGNLGNFELSAKDDVGTVTGRYAVDLNSLREMEIGRSFKSVKGNAVGFSGTWYNKSKAFTQYGELSMVSGSSRRLPLVIEGGLADLKARSESFVPFSVGILKQGRKLQVW